MQGVAGTVGMMQQPTQQKTSYQPGAQVFGAQQSSNQQASQNQEVQTPPSSAASSVSEDPYEKLAKLNGLLDQGVITQEDFDAAKSKLLDV